MAAESPLDALFERLDKAVKNEQHKKALKTADEILAIDTKDEDAIRVKAAALLNMGDWEAALKYIDSTAILASSMQFEKAYCLYRMGKIPEGLAALKPLLPASAGGTSAGAADSAGPALELAAQLHYRLGNAQQCIQLYDALFQAQKGGESSVELRTNVLAAYVAAGLARELPGLMTAMKLTARDSFEVAFNKACGLVESGEWGAAEAELKAALKLGRETLFEEDCSEEEVEDELAPLTVQLAYVQARQGRLGEAQELLDKVLHGVEGGNDALLSDETTRAVASNNAAAISLALTATAATSGPAHAAAGKAAKAAAKKLAGMLEDGASAGSLRLSSALAARMSAAQQRLLTLNRGLAYLLCGRMDAAREVVNALLKQDAAAAPSALWLSPHLLPLLSAAVLAKEGKGSEADSVLAAAASASGAGVSGVEAAWPVLARAQLALEAGDSARAACVLDALAQPPELSSSPALLATRVALHQQLGTAEGAESLLLKAISTLGPAAPAKPGKGAPAPASSPVVACLEALVALRLKLGRVPDALAAFGQLRAAQGAGAPMSASTASLLARLVRCVAVSDAPSALPTATKLASELPPLAGELRGVDVEALEGAALGARGAAVKRGADDMEVDGRGAAASKAAGRRPPKKKDRAKRKRRLPKGYNPDLPNGGLPTPDPERWLPKWQRTETKRRKKTSAAREKGNVKGSQGAGKVDESLDITKQAARAPADTKAGSKAPSLPARPTKKSGKK
uniref:Signal recognition particle subunit SRP72 n=1 Tax=Chlamydomonas leiostraca TaxID=1034604 RepID=A0A7S0RTI0_9CHLO|mmetsp:Transcript_31231/g.79627  ORF Transcript_31231/g.79627 Transcript_31231/m.79627 type:complete len:743 (+) Transcript_31231:118-2346(+)|eukprot:CAMPEP_0202857338 /NCGR_PEP_ID=MMETSP1391-20130828/322_1 /ASSEMBLY_ACC=CAM_ASM_000867 /TAXON_ID=1034604 /ORGANISM="Chlamydomonas leiostraca, Strain SAG 11-49" /LENGTH=742 /DNA_ID=CAMNT_0049536129 /DNA_START=118 /DNA_END=2346 /DNA_ORIENTATION=-